MFYGFCCLYSLLLTGNNVFGGIGVNECLSYFWKLTNAFFYWVSGHIFGCEQFYSGLTSPSHAWDFMAWANASGFSEFSTYALPLLLAMITSIIVVWGLVRLIVKVCSLGKITY